jgi:U3 small nucleolar RNA-associated protein 7
MAQNPYNAIIMVGDPRGQVTMWCPNTGVPIVKMLCHAGAINTIAADHAGKHLVTAGTDGKMKVWDIRTYKVVHEYWNPTPAHKLSISQKGLLAVGLANEVQVFILCLGYNIRFGKIGMGKNRRSPI